MPTDLPPTDLPPTVFLLFGATGDLSSRMVLPAFYTLADKGMLPERWILIGNGTGDVAHEHFRTRVHHSLTTFGPKPTEPTWRAFSERLRFAGGGLAVDSQLHGAVTGALAELGEDAQLVCYLAVPPTAFGPITQALGATGLAGRARVVYEKPFGTSPADFAALNAAVHDVLAEDQVYRIDHFLGKEATQNLHVLRFANSLFGNVWNHERVAMVQIDVPETLDIANRAVFYDKTGAVLDMLVTHLFQVAAEIAMEPPRRMTAQGLQSAREEVIAAFRPLDPGEVVLGQYDGYAETPGVTTGSTTDTYVAARLWVDNHRWAGVPFLLRTGKMMTRSAQQVSVILKPPIHDLYHVPADSTVLGLSLAGGGRLDLDMVVKKPGGGLEVCDADAAVEFPELADPLPPYVRLIHDVILGDRSLFTRPDGLQSAWDVVRPLLDARPAVHPYAAGSWGPAAAADLAAPHRWLLGA